MSSQVITTYPEPPTRSEAAPPTDPEAEGPGKQKNFYRHVSGAGEGHTLQTTADFPGTNSSHIVDPVKDSEMTNGESLPNGIHELNLEQNGGAKSSSQNNDEIPDDQEENKHLEPDWQKKIRSLQDQILAVLLNVDKSQVDVTIGRTALQSEKPLTLEWNKDQQAMTPVKEDQTARPDIIAGNEEEKAPREDGVFFYFAVKVKEEFKDEEEKVDEMRKLFRNDFNNNPGTIQKKVKRSIIKKVTNDKGETVEVEVFVNKRKVTRNIIDERSGRVMEVETEVTTDDSDQDVLNQDGTISKQKKRKTRRGRTGGRDNRDEDDGESRIKRRVRRRKLTKEEAEKAYIKSKSTGDMPATIRKRISKTGEVEYFEEEIEEIYSDEEYSDGDGEYEYSSYDEDEYGESDDASGRSRRNFRLDPRRRKAGLMRGGRGGGHPKLRAMQARFRRKFCGHGGRPGTIEEEDELRRAKGRRRTKSMMGEDEYDEFDDYYDDDDEFGDFDGYVNYLRHEFCYDEFAGFGEEYDGPKGILTSFLPDGTSTSPRKTSKNEGQQQKEKNADSDNENGYEDDENVSPLLRSVSKISTIPEEDPEHDALSQAGAGQEACRTPLGSAHHLRPLARAIQVPNRIRRLRSRAVGANSKKVWYTGSTDRSFNSKCSKRFETKDLEEDAVHYYYYRSLPAIQTRERYLPSITSSLENIESPTKLPNVVSPTKKRSELLLL